MSDGPPDRIGVVSDVHGNRVAFDAVLEDMPPVDAMVCAGDVVGYNPWPAACIDRLREREVPTVMGNHDRAVVTGSTARLNAMATAGVNHARRDLDEDRMAWLEGLPTRRRLFGDRVLLVHGHPDDPDHYTRQYEVGPELLRGAEALIMGHTHVQFHERFEDGVVMNPGSVGQPRDGDPRAAYAILDLDDGTVEERRVEYDIDRVIDAVGTAGLPDRIGSRLREGR